MQPRMPSAVVWMLAAVASMAGCASSGTRADGSERARPAGRPAEAAPQRADWPLPVWPGTTLVMEWTAPGSRPAEALRVTGPGGGALPVSLWHVRVEPAGASWAGPIGRWDATPVDVDDDESLRAAIEAARGARTDTLMLAVEIPPGFHGEEIVVGRSRVRVAPSPELIEGAWVSPMPPYADWGALLPAAAADEAHPLYRWRARLLRAGVPDDPTRRVADFENPLLEAVAVQEELRWRTGLSRLHAASPAAASQIRARLLATVQDDASSTVVPVWNQEARPLEQLKDILLDDRTSPATLGSRALSWARRQPEAAVWFEHAFAQDTPGAPAGFVRAWVGNASERDVLAWMEFLAVRPAGSIVPEPVVLRPGELRLIEAPVAIPAGPGEPVDVEIHAGARVERAPVLIGSLPAEPPGVVLGPLIPAHDAASLLGGEAAAVEGGRCTALLRRVDGPGLAPPPLATRSRWSMLVECARYSGGSPGTIRIDFAHEAGRTGIEVERDGTVRVEAPPGLPTGGYPTLVPVVEDGSVWSAEVPVPDWCVGLDDRLRVGLLRRGASGGLWSWPTRALRMAPHRAGLAVIDLRAWDRGSGVATASP